MADGKCPVCGAPLTNQSCQYCGYVGNERENTGKGSQPQVVIQNVQQTNVGGGYVHKQNVSSKSKWVAFFLCLFFGFFGVHKFYVGKMGSGLLFLITGDCLESDGSLI